MRLIPLLVLLMACSSTPTKYNQRVMRIMVDPDSLPQTHYIRVVQSLMQSGKWTVVDRARGWQAVKEEQQRLHKDEHDRYEDEEKWAMWGKMYGVGGVVIANAQCEQRYTRLIHSEYLACLQTLSLVDSNTSEIIMSISHEQEGDVGQIYIPPSWDGAVASFNKSFPSGYKAKNYESNLKEYAQDAKKNAEENKKREPAREQAIIVNE